jgi:hypothetical protein
MTGSTAARHRYYDKNNFELSDNQVFAKLVFMIKNRPARSLFFEKEHVFNLFMVEIPLLLSVSRAIDFEMFRLKFCQSHNSKNPKTQNNVFY